MEKLRTQELLMRSFVELDERAWYLHKDAKEDLWCQEFINHHLHKAESEETFPNMGTRANVVDKMKDIQKDR